MKWGSANIADTKNNALEKYDRYKAKMNILELAKKLVCDINPTEARRLNLVNMPVQKWPSWAKTHFRLACDAMVAACEHKSDLPNVR